MPPCPTSILGLSGIVTLSEIMLTCKYRVSHNIGSTLFFAILLASTLPKYKKLGEYKKIQEICYKIGTKNLKIDLELAGIMTGAIFDVNYLS